MTIAVPRSVGESWEVGQFLDFLESRPSGERWELIDGQPLMMTPGTHVQQALSLNLIELLNAALRHARPDLRAFPVSGVRVAGRIDFFAVPDLVVLPAEADYAIWSQRFYLTAEVRSASNTAREIEAKLARYREAPDNQYALVVDQRQVRVDVYAREADWSKRSLSGLDEVLALPAFGFSCPLRDIYRGTPLLLQRKD